MRSLACLLVLGIVLIIAGFFITMGNAPVSPTPSDSTMVSITNLHNRTASGVISATQASVSKFHPDGHPTGPTTPDDAGETISEPERRKLSDRISNSIQSFTDQSAATVLRPFSRGVGDKVLDPEQQQAVESLKTILGNDAVIHMDAKSSTLRYLDGDLEPLTLNSFAYQTAKQVGDYEGMAVALAHELRNVLNVEAPAESFVTQRVQQNPEGTTHVFLQQQRNGVPFWGAQLGIHFDEDGDPYQVSGVYAPRPEDVLIPSSPLTEDQAIAAALDGLGLTRRGIVEPRVEPIVYWDLDQIPQMSYRVHLVPKVFSYWQVFVSMDQGEIIHRHKAICAQAATGQSTGLLGQTLPVNSYLEQGTYFLVDTSLPMYDPTSQPPAFNETRGAVIVADLQNQVLSGSFSAPLVTSDNPDAWDPAGVSVQNNFREVEAYFRNTFNRNSIDDNGMNIVGVIHVRYPLPDGGSTADNASWNGAIQTMFFGDGDGGFINLPDSLDVTGHEVTHGVIEHTANLIYENQSGALNEHIADVFGAMIDRDEWFLGDGYTAQGPGLRDMQNPSNPQLTQPQPSTFSQFVNLPNTPQGDNGGVHVNSGIPNRMTYLLAEGPQGIGRDKTEQITYRALTTYLTQRSQFIDYRRAMLSAATDLYGADSPEVAVVASAFDAVEIFDAGDGGGTPPPTEAPPTTGDDFSLILAADPATFDGNFFQYTLNIEGPTGIGLLAPRFVANTRPAISGDGSFALYVDASFNLWITDGVSETLIDGSGFVRTIAMSKDQRFVAYTTTDFSNTVTILDLVQGTQATFPLQIVDRNNNFIDLKFADVLSFNFRGDFLIFDAAVDIQVPGQSPVEVWGIYSLRVVDGFINQFFPVVPGQNIGNPNMANTTDHNLLADILIEENDGSFSFGMLSIELLTQEAFILPFELNDLGQPAYRADDSQLLFRHFDGQQYFVLQATFTPDGFSFIDNSISSLVSNPFPLAFPVGFRVGEFSPVQGQIAVAPEIDFGPVEINQQESLGLVVQNQGEGDLQLIEISIDGPDAASFGYVGTNQTIPAQGSKVVSVAFRPEREGEHLATLRIRSTDPNQNTVEVALLGSALPAQIATPIPPTPTVPPVLMPTATPQPSELPLLASFEFNEVDLSSSGWSELPGGFESRVPGTVSLGTLNGSIVGSTDNDGLTIEVLPQQLVFLFTTEPLNSLGDPVLIRAQIRTEGNQASLALGALKGGLFSSQDQLDGSLGLTFPATTASYIDESGWISVVYQPDSGEILNPFIQLAHTGADDAVRLFIDRVEIYQLNEGNQIPVDFVRK